MPFFYDTINIIHNANSSTYRLSSTHLDGTID